MLAFPGVQVQMSHINRQRPNAPEEKLNTPDVSTKQHQCHIACLIFDSYSSFTCCYADRGMDIGDIPPFHGNITNVGTSVASAITRKIEIRQRVQMTPLELPRTPPLKAANLEQLNTTPRSNSRRAIRIVSPYESRNGLSALAAPFVPWGRYVISLPLLY